MTQYNEEPIFLKNYVEELVTNMLDELSVRGDFCTCRRCRLDMIAYALNRIPAKYVVTQTGEVYTKISHLEQQLEVDITVALTQAIETVSKNPRHDSHGS
ncbi:MAG TPA: late competence development ComFB family protein [Clostridia bacterium]|nr:late competence development ComFB family protein [Clostridia bacterium]